MYSDKNTRSSLPAYRKFPAIGFIPLVIITVYLIAKTMVYIGFPMAFFLNIAVALGFVNLYNTEEQPQYILSSTTDKQRKYRY